MTVIQKLRFRFVVLLVWSQPLYGVKPWTLKAHVLKSSNLLNFDAESSTETKITKDVLRRMDREKICLTQSKYASILLTNTAKRKIHAIAGHHTGERRWKKENR